MNDNNKEDPSRYKREGYVQLKITNFREFVREEQGDKTSEPVQVLGLKWKIFARIKYDDRTNSEADAQKYMGIFLECDCKDGDFTLSCTASATMKLLAQKQDKQDHVRNIDSREYKVDGLGWGFGKFMSIEKLMDPESGWYDEVNDSIVLTADIKVEDAHGISYSCTMARKDNVEFYKHQLAFHSVHFKHIYFGEKCDENNKLRKLLASTKKEHFGRMLDTLHPKNKPLDDECIEGVLYLAKQFLMTEVEEKCRDFLAKESKKSVIFKYRLAEKYGFDGLKKQLLDSSKKQDFFKEGDFLENIKEYIKLDEKAREAVMAVRLGPVPPPVVGIRKRFWLGSDTIWRAILPKAKARGQENKQKKRALEPEVVLVNDVQVKVDKHQLAANSDFFERFFFGEDSEKNTELVVELPGTVGHFERMLDTLHPKNKPLDDQCIEGVLHLANQFLLLEVEAKCRNFLLNESKHSVMFKYRLADKYSFNLLKKLILDWPKEKFLKEDDFFENLEEYAKLDLKAREALDAGIGQLFDNNKKDVAQ